MVTSVVMKDDDLERIYDVLEVTKGRVIRILTSVFPRYFAIITRVREDVRSIGPDGGKVVLPQDPRLRATFPKNALYKKIKASFWLRQEFRESQCACVCLKSVICSQLSSF